MKEHCSTSSIHLHYKMHYVSELDQEVFSAEERHIYKWIIESFFISFSYHFRQDYLAIMRWMSYL